MSNNAKELSLAATILALTLHLFNRLTAPDSESLRLITKTNPDISGHEKLMSLEETLSAYPN